MNDWKRLRSTATYSHANRQKTARSYFTSEKVAGQLDPTPHQYAACVKAATCVDIGSSNYPSAEDVVCDFLGVTPTDDASAPETGRTNAHMLRLAFKLFLDYQQMVESQTTQRTNVECPYCHDDSITCHIGTIQSYDPANMTLIPQSDPSVVAINILCNCHFGVDDIDKIHGLALTSVDID